MIITDDSIQNGNGNNVAISKLPFVSFLFQSRYCVKEERLDAKCFYVIALLSRSKVLMNESCVGTILKEERNHCIIREKGVV